MLAKIRAGEKIDHYETIRQRKDGTRLSISLTVSPIRDETGEIVGASKIARDITRAVASPGRGARARDQYREAGRGRRRRRLHARPRDHRPEGHRHRDGADARASSARSSTT